MPGQTRMVLPGPSDRSVRTANGQILHPPVDWVLLPPGDATFTRRVKEAAEVPIIDRIKRVGGRIMGRFWYNPCYGDVERRSY